MSTKQIIKVELNEKDLAFFLDGSLARMEKYRAELQRRLSEMGEAEVLITPATTDKIEINGMKDKEGVVNSVMDQMVDDWSWLGEW